LSSQWSGRIRYRFDTHAVEAGAGDMLPIRPDRTTATSPASSTPKSSATCWPISPTS